MLPQASSAGSSPRIAVIGAGFAGIGAAVKLRQAGFHDVTVLERAGDVGGVWRDNVYPGCACDVQSHLYSLSFAPNPSWTRAYSPQPEILDYLRRTARDFQVTPKFHHEVRDIRWQSGAWHIETAQHGTIEADVVVGAQGALSEPALPNIAGLEGFGGKVMHSARWDESYDITGKRVAIIGTGASAIQIIPHAAKAAAHLAVFQRTPPWVFPRNDHEIPAWRRRLFERSDLARRVMRAFIRGTRSLLLNGFVNARVERFLRGLAVKFLRASVRDRALRARLTPDYKLGCKRILLSDDYYPAMQRDNVTLVTDGIREITERGVVDASGVEHAVDCIVVATGFQITDPPFARHVVGRDGRTMKDFFGKSPRAHVGTTVPGFPNFFIMQGPNTGLGHTSVLEMIEGQLDHVVDAVAHIAAHGAIEPTQQALDQWLAEVDRDMKGTVWVEGGCSSWYLDETGRNSTIWPGSTTAYRKRARFVASDYRAPPSEIRALAPSSTSSASSSSASSATDLVAAAARGTASHPGVSP
jgi:cation diffusion facilitator CzcD-associated flavoprotein CzcO